MYLKDETVAIERLEKKDNLFSLLNPDKTNRVPKIKVVKEKYEKTILAEVTEVLVPKKLGRKKGSKTVPPLVKELAGAAAHFSDPKVVAAEFGLSPAQVTLYKQGKTTAGAAPNPVLQKAVNQSVTEVKSAVQTIQNKIHKKALKKLSRTLDFVSVDKLTDAKLRDVSAAVRNLSHAAQVLDPEAGKKQSDHGPQVVFYAPQVKTEDDYDHVKIRSRDRR